jgi:hypothetical protein
MNTVAAEQLLRKLRSFGVKVTLGKGDAVTFRTEDMKKVPAPMKLEITRLGRGLKAALLKEARIKELRRQIKQSEI